MTKKNQVRAVVGAALVVTGAVIAQWGDQAGLDVWNIDELQRQAATARDRNLEMDRECDQSMGRIEIKMMLARELAAGRMTFPQAMDQCNSVNQADPRVLDLTRRVCKGETDRERAGYQIIGYLRAMQTPESRELALTLECEMACGYWQR